ncbi:MAG: prolyl aminopeptidase, partial [Candidatus Dormibacteraeota bacterium]|nr:prolyl aminopeptidase [Candidatus Dormibacteraeota bacterium]
MTPGTVAPARRERYPLREPFATHRLEVGDGHTLFVEEVGRPDGIPAVVLHGGPGGGITPRMRGYFDPDRYHVVLFDQRGAGRSTPGGSVEANTTWDLVRDIETVREHLGIERWLVFGGSWGSTLALAYAEYRPDRVTGLVLRGIFLGRPREVEWLIEGGAAPLNPAGWERFLAPIPPVEQANLLLAYSRRLFGPDREEARRCGLAWNRWENECSALVPSEEEEGTEEHKVTMARIECHYFVHGCFLAEPDQLLDGIDAIRHLPATIVQGRYDLVCPPVTAWEL